MIIEYRDFKLEESDMGVYATALNESARLVAFKIGELHKMNENPVLWRDYDLEIAKEFIDHIYRIYERNYFYGNFPIYGDSLYRLTYLIT